MNNTYDKKQSNTFSKDEAICGFLESKTKNSLGYYDIEISFFDRYREDNSPYKDNSPRQYVLDQRIAFKVKFDSQEQNFIIGSYVTIYLKPHNIHHCILADFEKYNEKTNVLKPNHKPFSDCMLNSLEEKYNIVFIGSRTGYCDSMKDHRLSRIIDLSPAKLERHLLVSAFKKVEELQKNGLRVDILALGVGGTNTHEIFYHEQIIYHFNRISNVVKYCGLGHSNTITPRICGFATESFSTPAEMGFKVEAGLNSALQKLMPQNTQVIQPIIQEHHHTEHHHNTQIVHVKQDNKKMKVGISFAILLASVAIGLFYYDKIKSSNASPIQQNIESTPSTSSVPQNTHSKSIASKIKHKIKKVKKITPTPPPQQLPQQPEPINVQPAPSAPQADSSFSVPKAS